MSFPMARCFKDKLVDSFLVTKPHKPVTNSDLFGVLFSPLGNYPVHSLNISLHHPILQFLRQQLWLLAPNNLRIRHQLLHMVLLCSP